MPTYAYECTACGHGLEEFQTMTAKPLRKCPACKALKLKRLIGPGAGFIFKGTGFYITDYRNKKGGGESGGGGDAKETPGKTAESGKSDAGTGSGDSATSKGASKDKTPAGDTGKGSSGKGDSNKGSSNKGKGVA